MVKDFRVNPLHVQKKMYEESSRIIIQKTQIKYLRYLLYLNKQC